MRTQYLYDDVTGACIAEFDENGDTQVEYITNPQTGELISENHNGQEVYHHYDGEGNTHQTADSAGNVLGEATYDAFGETVAESGDMGTTHRFRGQQGFSTDPLTGVVSKANQNYSPPIGRRLGNPNPEYSVATAWEADSISTTSAWPQSTRGYVCGGTSSSPWIDPYHGGLAGGVGTILGGERIGTINASAAIGISSGGSKKFDCRQAYVTLTLSLSSTERAFSIFLADRELVMGEPIVGQSNKITCGTPVFTRAPGNLTASWKCPLVCDRINGTCLSQTWRMVVAGRYIQSIYLMPLQAFLVQVGIKLNPIDNCCGARCSRVMVSAEQLDYGRPYPIDEAEYPQGYELGEPLGPAATPGDIPSGRGLIDIHKRNRARRTRQ